MLSRALVLEKTLSVVGRTRVRVLQWVYYQALSGTIHVSLPWKIIWKSRVPPRVAFFVWTAALGRILTIDNLQRRHVMVLDWCCLCKNGGETIDHLLFHCSFA